MKSPTPLSHRIIPTCLALAALAVTASAQTTFTWTGAAGDDNWLTAGNWLGGVAPTDAAAVPENVIRFDVNTTSRFDTGVVNLASGFDLSQIIVADISNPVVIRAGATNVTLDLIPNAGLPTIDMSAATQDFSIVPNGSAGVALNLGSFNHVWDVAAGRTLSVLTVTGSAANTLTFNGGGTTIFSGAADNSNLRVVISGGGTVVELNKASTQAVHALGANATSTIGVGTTLRLGAAGTGGDQIFRTHDMIINGTFDLNGKTEGFDILSSTDGVSTGVITSGVAGASMLRFADEGTAGVFGGVIQNGAGIVSVMRAYALTNQTQTFTNTSTFTGTTTLSRGITQFTGVSGALSGTTGITLDGFAQLHLDNRTTVGAFAAGVNNNRLNDAAPINLRGGGLTLLGVATANVSEAVGAITLGRGHNTIRLSSDTVAGTNATGITATGLSRTEGGTVTIVADNLTNAADFGTATTGDVGYFRTVDAPASAELSGASGTGVDRDIFIGGFASGSATNANGSEFLTMELSGGFYYFRPLTSAEYTAPVSGSFVESNVNVTATTPITSSTAFNSVRFGGGSLTIAPGKKLYLGGHAADLINPTVTEGSGMILFNTGTFSGFGSVDFGSRDIISRVLAAANVDASLSTSGNFIKGGGSALGLNAPNVIGGTVYLNDGDLTLRNDRALGTSSAGVVVTGGSANTRLLVRDGINVSGKLLTLGVSSVQGATSTQVALRADAGINSWAGDIVAGNVALGGNAGLDSQLQVNADATLVLTGNLYGASVVALDNTYTADVNHSRRFSTANSTGGVVNILGKVRDTATGAASTQADRLRFTVTGNAELSVNIAQSMEVSGLLHVTQGYLRYTGMGNFFDASVASSPISMLFDPSAGTASQGAVLLTQAGQTFVRRTAAATDLIIGNANNTTMNNFLIGGEHDSGIVEFGSGTQTYDFNPRTTDDAGTAGILDQFRDLRLYSREGAETVIRASFTDDAGETTSIVTTNEVGALTKVGRGTVRIVGRNANGNVDGGAYTLGGTLIFDYSTNNNNKVHSTIEGAQFTAAGGDLQLVKTNGGTIVERMSGSFTARNGLSEVALDAATGANITLRLATAAGSVISTAGGAAVNFVETGVGTRSILMGLAANQNTRIGSWATYGSAVKQADSWAFIAATNDVLGYTHSPGEIDTFGAGLHTDLTVNPAALGAPTTSASLRVNNAAVTALDLGGQALTLSEGGLLVGSAHNAALAISNGSFTSGGDLTLHNYSTGSVAVDADITGAGLVHLTGTGTKLLNGAKSFTGELRISGGTVVISDPASLGTGAAFSLGGTLRTSANMTIAKPVTLLGDGGVFEVDAATTNTLSGIVGNMNNFIFLATNPTFNAVTNAANTDNVGVGDVIKTGTGTLLLTNIANVYEGLTDIRAGTLRVAMTDASGTQTPLGKTESWLDGTIVRSGATLEVTKAAGANIPILAEFMRFEGGSTFRSSSGRFAVIGQVEITGPVTFDAVTGGQIDLAYTNGAISGSGDILKTGPGNILIGGNNILYTGAITIENGVFATRGQGIGAGADLTDVITIGGTGTTAEYRRMSNGQVLNNTLVEGHNILVTGTGTKRIGGGNASAPLGDDSFVYNGSITLNTNAELNFEAGGATVAGTRTGYLKLNGATSGAANITTRVTGGNATAGRVGVFQLNAANPAWTGVLTLGNATSNTLNQHIVRLGNPAATSAANAVTMRNDSTLQVGGNAVTIGTLTTNGGTTHVIENAAYTPGTLTISQITDATWDTLFQDGTPTGTIYENEAGSPGAPLNLVKDGAGIATMTLANPYTGTTDVLGGTLIISGSITGSTLTSVSTGGTLGGTGSTGALRTIGGTLAPGISGAGTFSATNVEFAGGTFAVDIHGVHPLHDRLNANGTVNISAATDLSITLGNGYIPVEGDSFILVDNSAAGATTTPHFFRANGVELPYYTDFSAAGYLWQLDYNSGDGNDILLIAVPEPGSAVLLLAGLGLLARRRRAASLG